MNGIEALNSLQKKYGISDIPKTKEPQATQSAAFGTTGIKQTGNSALDALNNKYLNPVKTNPVPAQNQTSNAPVKKISAEKAAALLAQVKNLPASNAVIKADTRTPEQVVADNEAMQIIKDQQKPTVWSQAAARDKATSAGTFGAAITPALKSTGNPYDEDPLEKYKIEGISEDRLNAYEQAAAKSRNNLLTLAQEETNQGDFIKQYTYMTPEEKKLYNRLYGLYGKDRAEEFHNLLLDKINDRIAADKYKENVEGKSTAGKVAYSFGQGVKSGLEGLKDVPETLLGVSRTKAKPVGEYVNERLRTDEDNSTLENIAYDLAQTSGYMIPGIAASYLTGGLGASAGTAQAVGNLVFALSQYGNTYREDINAGKDASSAGLRALQQGADEMVTNALLGGIGAFGGGALKKVLGNTKAGNALKEGLGKLAKTESGRKALMNAGDYLADMGSEAAQEYLQYFTENLGKQILYGESDLKWDPSDPLGSITQNLASPDAWYAAALGALNAGVMNAPAAVGDAVKLKSDSNTIRTEAELDIRQRRETAEKEGKALEAYGTTDPERQVAFREAEIIANRFGNKMDLSDGNTEGSYQNGKITINKNTTNPVMEVLFHELTHHLETKNDYASFAKYALDYIANDMGADVQTLKENIIKDYAEGGITLDDQGAERELVAKFTESKLFHDEAAVNRLYNTDPSLFQRIYYWIQDSVKKLTGTQEEKRLMEAQNLFQKVMKSGQAEEKAQIENLYAGENSKGADLKALDMARQLDERGVSGEEIRQQTGWFKGMDGKWRYEIADNGMKTDTTGAHSRNQDIVKDSLYTDEELSDNTDFERFIPENNNEESTIKDQIIKGAELVADMESVATINRPVTGIRSDLEKKKYAWGVLKDKLGKIVRRGFGTVDIGKKAVDKSTSYIRSEADLLAYEAIPDVIEKGRIVEGHRKHKNNDFPTLTIAAPVTINEKDGIMAVVIKNTGANRYKAHRVLTPSGTILELNENEELVRPDNPKLNSNDPITNSSKEDIASNDKDVKPLPSPGAEGSQKSYGRKLDDLVKPLASPASAVDSEGNALSEKQNAYFADSKVRDEEGKLKVMYHGSPNRFTVFDTEKFGGKNGKGEGYGIYFTDDESVAKPYSYGGNLLKGYLNITKPANSWEKTISKKELVKLIRDTCEDEARRMVADGEYDSFENAIKDSWISNYTNTYEKTMKANFDVVADSILENCENDNDIIQEVLNGSGVYSYKDANRFYKVLKDSIGIDGLMTHWKNPETGKESTVALAFNSNQFKNSSNSIPTANPDIELSYGRSLDELVSTARPLAAPGLKTEKTAEQPAAGKKTETLPAKAQTYMNRAENRLLEDITKVLGASKYADRRYMKRVAREISEEYLREGKISDESMSRLFGEAYEQARVSDEAWLNQYRGIQKYIDDTTLKVSDELISNFADPKMWQKKARTYVKMGTDGTAVDTIYQELNEMYPDLFSDDIINEADQLERIVDVAKDLKNTERTLDNYYSEMSDEYREWQYRDFEATVSEMAGELNKVRRYTDEQTKKVEAKNITDEDIKKAYEGIHAARKNAEKVVSRNLLTERDNAVVGKLLRGEITMDDVSKMDDVNVSGVKAVYEAKAVYEKYADVVKEAKKQRKKALREKAAGYLQNAINWKDKKAGILYMRETAERNIRDIIPDRVEAEAIIDEYFKPVHTSEAESTRYKNARKQAIKELNLDRKVREGNKVSESYAVQLVGEAEANIEALKATRYGKQRDGRTEKEWRAALADFWAENPKLDKKKIYSAIEVFREQYNGMIEDVNKVLIRNGYEPIPYRKGYFPHFEIGETEGVFATVKNLLGIDTEVTSLPTTINGLTGSFRPGKTWFGNALERMGINTDYDAVMGYDKYVNGISDVIHHTDNIQNLRALAQEVRYQTSDEGIRKQIDSVLENENLSEEAKQAEIDEIYSKGKHVASNFVVWLDEYTNLLANKKSKLDRGVESMFGRDAYNVLKAFEGNVAANMVSLNPGSWLTNFIPLTQAWTTVSSKDMLAGMWDTLRSYKREDGFSNLSDYLTARKGSEDLIKNWDRDPNVKGLKAAGRQYAKVMDKASVGMDIVDNFTSEAIVRARYYQNLRSGMSTQAAISEADDFAAGLQAARSKGSMPTLFASKNPLIKLFTQFQLEVNNEFSWLMKDVPDDLKKEGLGKLAAGLFKFLIGSYLFNEIYEYFVGRRSALDPLGILNDTVGNATGYQIPNLVELATGEDRSFKTDKLSKYETASELGTALAEELPFVGGIIGGGRVPISSALPNLENVAKAALNDEWSGKKRASTMVKELAKPVLYSALPGGGGQIKKMAEGYKALAKGGSYSVDNQGNDILQYPVYKDDPKDLARAAVRTTLFGKSSLKEAREWVDSGFKSLNAKQTQFYEDLKDDGLKDREAMKFLKEFGDIKKTDTESANDRKRDYLKGTSLPGEVKADAYRQFASDKKKELLDALSGEDEGTAASVLMDMEGTDKKTDQQKILMDSKLSGAGKLTTYITMLASDNEKELIGKLSGEKEEAVMNFLSKWNDAQDAYDKAAAIKNSNLSAEGKKSAYLSKYSSEKEEEFIKNAGTKAVDALIELRLAENAQGDKKKAQYAAILDSGLNENQQIQLFMIKFGGDDEREKINAVRATGLSFTDYLNFKYYLSNVKKDENMTKKEKVEEKIRSFGLNAEQSNALWAMAGYTGQLKSGALSLAAPKLNELKAPELKVKKLPAP